MSPPKRQHPEDCMLTGGDGCKQVAQLFQMIRSHDDIQDQQGSVIATLSKDINALNVVLGQMSVRFEQVIEFNRTQVDQQNSVRQNMHEFDMELQRIADKITTAADTIRNVTELFNSAQGHCGDTRTGFECRISELEAQSESMAKIVNDTNASVKDLVAAFNATQGAIKVIKFVHTAILGASSLVGIGYGLYQFFAK